MEKEVMLKSYRKEVEVLTLAMEVPSYEPNDERGKWFPKYEDVLLKLFNNKREDSNILEIRNYYGSDKIAVDIDLTGYLEECYTTSKEEAIDHLIVWFKSGCDVADDKVERFIHKGYVHTILEYEMKTENNYVRLEY